MNADKSAAGGAARNLRELGRTLTGRLGRDRRSAELRRLLARAPARPVNMHLLTDEDILRMLGRRTTARRIHLTPDRWWAEDRRRADTGSGPASTDTAKSEGTGGKAVKSSAESAADRRPRRMPADGRPADRPFPPASGQAPEPKNWIEFHLLDDESDTPIANVPFRLSLPDGSVAEHTSDGDGLIRLTDLPPGFCDIQAILDQGALEVVRIA